MKEEKSKKNILDKFSTRLKKSLSASYAIAKENGENVIKSQHILKGLYLQEGSIATEVLRKSNLEETALQTLNPNIENVAEGEMQNLGKIFKFIQSEESEKKDTVRFSRQVKKAILKAILLAKRNKHAYVGTEHLLYTLVENEKSNASKLLKKHNADMGFIKDQLKNILESTGKFAEMTAMFNLNKKKAKKASPTLKNYCEDLTSPKFVKDIDPVIGRDKEIERIVHILGRRNKNNALLVGEPGVGKTALAEGLARRIAEGSVPPILRKKKILRLDLAKIIAGTMFRGEFEGRLKNLIDSASKNPNIIIFIDEIHTIIGLGNAQGSLDANNILKPALTKGNFQCIGTTTFDEYKKHIENDTAFERRFQVIKVEEPTIEEANQIILGIKDQYETYHSVNFNDKAIKAAVKLSDRYIPEKQLPDKALDILDEAAAQINIERADSKLYTEIEEKRKNLEELETQKHEMAMNEKFQEALKLQAEEQKLKKEIKDLHHKQKRKKSDWPTITEDDIAHVISGITEIPLKKIMATEKEKLLNLESILKKKIIGQDEAIDAIAKFTRRARSGLTHPNRPTGSFMFLGPTGTGKTELAKVIAEEIFEDENALIRIDMSEFGEKFNSSKLIGAPAGYVGFEEGGKLTESVRKKPYSVVLFDEIEKAHPDIFNLLLQILDEGFITDASGKKVNFRNTIIVMTSNTGSKSIMEDELGFVDASDEEKKKEDDYQIYQEKIKNELKDAFRPEFLNRIDRMIVFRPLDQEAINKIVKIHLKELQDRLGLEKNLTLEVSKSIEKEIAEVGFDPERGARPLRRAIQELIEDALAEKIIEEVIQDGDTVSISKDKNGVVVTKK